MTNEELAREGFELCEGSAECDFCGDNGECFWRRTSYEYVEGEYACRLCAVKKIEADMAFIASFDPVVYAAIAGIDLTVEA